MDRKRDRYTCCLLLLAVVATVPVLSESIFEDGGSGKYVCVHLVDRASETVAIVTISCLACRL